MDKELKEKLQTMQRSIDALYTSRTEHNHSIRKITSAQRVLNDKIDMFDFTAGNAALARMADLGKLFDGVYTRYTVVTELIHYAVANGDMDNDTRLTIVRGAMLLLDSDDEWWKENHDKTIGELSKHILKIAKSKK